MNATLKKFRWLLFIPFIGFLINFFYIRYMVFIKRKQINDFSVKKCLLYGFFTCLTVAVIILCAFAFVQIVSAVTATGMGDRGMLIVTITVTMLTMVIASVWSPNLWCLLYLNKYIIPNVE